MQILVKQKQGFAEYTGSEEEERQVRQRVLEHDYGGSGRGRNRKYRWSMKESTL